jgi:hypothetical protein
MQRNVKKSINALIGGFATEIITNGNSGDIIVELVEIQILNQMGGKLYGKKILSKGWRIPHL